MTQSFKQRIFHIFFCAWLLLTLPCLTSCGEKKEPVTRSGFYFDTVITITLYGDEEALSPVFEELFSICGTYEAMLSGTKQGSDIWNINHAAGKPVTVSPETLSLLQTALSYSELTAGLIDPTVAPVSELWGFESGVSAPAPSLPDEDALLDALSHVGYQKIMIDQEACEVALTDPQTALSLGFIAKGYIADRLRDYLLSQNVTSAVINLGGNTLCIGEKPDGSAYRIGIQYPYGNSGEIIASLSVRDQSIVTSGVYERYIEADGTRYHHILDPKSGYPIENGLLSVTILSASSAQGDALSTTCFALGLTDGMALVESLSGVEAVFITDDYELHYSDGLR